MAEATPTPRKRKSTPKPAAKEVTQVLAEVEYRKFNRETGERESKPFNQYYTIEEWMYLQEHGPKRRLFVNKVIEAPTGINTSYQNPGS